MRVQLKNLYEQNQIAVKPIVFGKTKKQENLIYQGYTEIFLHVTVNYFEINHLESFFARYRQQLFLILNVF